jgi:hypothetical protein
LAAPVLATLKILGIYVWRKMLDLPPFPEKPPDSEDDRHPSHKEGLERFLHRFGARPSRT